MKCYVCGYEQEEDFKEFEMEVPIYPGIKKLVTYHGIYVCPKCHTTKANIDPKLKGEK